MTYENFIKKLLQHADKGEYDSLKETLRQNPDLHDQLIQRSEEAHQGHWESMKKKLTAELGEDWVKEHCKD